MEPQEDAHDTRDAQLFDQLVWHRKHVRHGDWNPHCVTCQNELELVRQGK